MKIFSLIAALIGFIIVVILSFENIQASCTYLQFFFWEPDVSVTFIIFGTAVMGMFTGLFAGIFLALVMKGGEEDDEYDEDFDA